MISYHFMYLVGFCLACCRMASSGSSPIIAGPSGMQVHRQEKGKRHVEGWIMQVISVVDAFYRTSR